MLTLNDVKRSGMDLPLCGIYLITNAINGKIYVGCSINIPRRIYHHKCRLNANKHANKHLQRSINKHGLASFTIKILKKCKSGLLSKIEQSYLDSLNCFSPHGYNIEPLAGQASHAPETKAKLSKLAKERWENPTMEMIKGAKRTKEKNIASGLFDRISKNKTGVPRSEQTRKKLSTSIRDSEACKKIRQKIADSKRGTKRPPEEVYKIQMNARGRKGIIQIDNNGKEINRFRSLRHAREITGFAPCEISKVCKGQYSCYPKSNGFKWSFENENHLQ
tara:strand:+ start:534 stop:1364 length:831 start_codon:yes stop_codon:yes gene_type:complete